MSVTRDELEFAETETEGETLLPTGAETTSEASAQPHNIGRYVLLHRLGVGGMGVVFAAYDPQLDRKVAIKLLKSQAHLGAEARLQREAQALAKLDHPNVVAVHDVGVHEGQVFVAMDFVAGVTLGKWMRRDGHPRPWREVLSVFMAAGRGLAAAHARGLIHRDFKPDNVMIGEDRRVRVMDFGLVRLADEDLDAPTAAPSDGRIDRLTQSAAVMGTPAYMSYEQFQCADVDARSDQFSFCVALHEALHGTRPFAGRSVNELLHALEVGRLAEPPTDDVPVWLRRVVMRGLAKDPAQRWPSMDALLLALADDPAPRRRRRAAIGVAALMIAGASWAVFRSLQADQAVCRAAASELIGTWDDDRRAAVEQALLQTDLPYAPEVWTKVEAQLDARAEAWQAAWTDACQASHDGSQSGELLDLRMACLDERRELMRATIDELARADATVLENAVEAVQALPSLDRCADAVALRAAVRAPEDPEIAERVAALDGELRIVSAKQNAGRYEDALKLAARVVDDALLLDHEPLHARAWLSLGELQLLVGEYVPAAATLRRALDAATAQHMSEAAAYAAILLTQVVGHRQSKFDEGALWAELADSLSRAAAEDDLRASYFNARGMMAQDQGDYVSARDYYTRSLTLLEQTKGPDDLALTLALNNLGIAADNLGESSVARSYHERALHIREAALAPEHPEVGTSLVNLASAEEHAGKHDEARVHYLRALTIFEGSLGPRHPDVALVLYSLGVVVASEQKFDEAREYHERALEIWEQALGPEALDVADALGALGVVATKQGKLDDARAYHRRALGIQERKIGSDHPNVGFTLANLGNVAKAARDFAEARDDYERALALWLPAYGPEHPLVGLLSTDIGEALIELGEFESAIAKLEQSERILAVTDGDPLALTKARFTLARALWDAPQAQGRDRTRARELAEGARDEAAARGEAGRAQLDEVDAWLASHEG